jgi:hypothetical protein
MQSYNKPLELLIGGPESYMKAKRSLSEIEFQERVNGDSILKMYGDRKRLGITSLFDKKHFNL